MAAVRSVSQRRPAAPPTPILQPKPQISLEEWEAKAPLSDLALKSVAAIKTASERSPLPLKVSTTSVCRRLRVCLRFCKVAIEDDASHPPTPSLRATTKLGSGSRPSTPVPAFARSQPSHALDPKVPIQTPQQFYDWFAQVDRSVAHSQEAHFRAHVATVAEHLATTDMLLERLDEVEKGVDSMLEEWRGVEEGGRSLKGACERLLEDRVSRRALYGPFVR